MKDIDRIVQKFKDAQDFNYKLSEHLKESLVLDGKTPYQWKKHFKVDIPDEVNPMIILELCADVFTKYQEAAMYRDKQTMQLTILEQSKEDKYNFAFHKARKDHEEKFKKNLSAKSCEIEATLAIKDIKDAIANQKIVKDFWKSTCDTLTELRKLLEMMGFALNTDARINNEVKFYGHNKENN
jgi:hypothetical protein